jgi:hypothetical protein
MDGGRSGDGEFIPLLGPAYHQYLPWWNVYLVGGAVTAMLLLARDRYMWALRGLDFGLALLLVAILWWMIHGEPLMQPDFVGMGGAVSDPEVVERFEEVVAPIVRVILRAGLWVWLIVAGYSALAKAVKMLRRARVMG